MTKNQPAGSKPRREIAHVNILGTTQLHLRNPYVIAFWSAMFPGFGHLLLSKYLRAFILFVWEIVINFMSHVNLTLFYTVLGKFDIVKEVVDIRWSLLYIPTFVFAIWDSYRAAVDINKQYILASREDAPVDTFVINPVGICYLDKRSPFVTAAWCLITPGLGHIMMQRVMHGVFLLFWWICIIYNSNFLTAFHLSFFGDFEEAGAALNIQWFLNIPSLLFFCIYTSYVNAVESNKLFDREQSRFLKENYQSKEFQFPIKISGIMGAAMFVISSFEQTIQVELAVTALEQEGIPKENIMAVPIERTLQRKKLFDTMHSYTGESMFDLPTLLGAVLMIFGCIYGFVLSWGPVVWGIIGGVAGFGIGLLIKFFRLRKKETASYENEIVIMVSCEESKTDFVKRLLWDNGARGVNHMKCSNEV